MTDKAAETKTLHDIKSRCSSLKGAAELFKDCSAGEKKEMLALMKDAARDIAASLTELEKGI